MKDSKTLRKDGTPKGVWIYSVKKSGELYKNPTHYTFVANEKTAEDVVKRLRKYNNNSDYVIANNQDWLNLRNQ